MLGYFSSAATFLYIGHLVNGPWGPAIRRETGGAHAAFHLFLAEFAFSAFCIFACSGIGFILSERYKMPGMGRIGEIKPLIGRFALIAIPFMPAGYFLHDRIFIQGAREHGWPAMIPASIGWSLAYMAHGALFKEVVFRFGLITLVSGLFRGRHPWWSVTVVTAFAGVLSLQELVFVKQRLGLDIITVSVYIWAIMLNAVLGVVYVRKGLWATMALRILIDIRLLFCAVMMWFL